MSEAPEVVILIVDDKEKNLYALERTLRDVPARVVMATSGEEALTQTLHNDISLAILDVQMPGMDGYELAELMLGDPLTSRIPIIFVTAAYSDEQHLFKGYQSGAVDYIIKPFNPLVLMGKVRVFLELARYRLGLERLVDERTRALQTSETQYRSLIENACDAIQCVREDHSIDFVNTSWKRLLGYHSAELLQQLPITQIIAPDALEAYLQMTRRVLGGMTETGFYTTCVSRSGDRVHLEGNIVPHRIGGHIVGTQGFFRDITARRTAEERLELAVRGSGALLWDWNIGAGTVRRTGGSGLLTGSLSGGLERRIPLAEWEKLFHPDDLERRLACLKEHFERGTDHYECELRMADGMGDWHWILDYGKVFERGVNREPVRMAGTLLDISMRKQAEEERARVVRAEAENVAKSSFLASMSHEMRTPLNAILGYAQLLGHEAGLSDRQRESLATILRSGDHLLSLINEVLDLAQIESGNLPLNVAEVDLRQLLIDLERMFRLKASERGLGLVVTGLEQLPRRVRTDARKVRQILINLLGNAMKFTEQGNIALRVGVGGSSATQASLVIEVEDSGCGIEADKLTHIFESFAQTEAGTRKLGAGLGLAVSRQLALALNGTLSVRSTVGTGSVFTFAINVELVDEALGAVDLPEQVVVGLAPVNSAFPVLVVDAQADSRVMLTRMLDAVGFSMCEALDTAEARLALKSERPGLVIWSPGTQLTTGGDGQRDLGEACRQEGVPLLLISSTTVAAQPSTVLADGVLQLPLLEADLFAEIARLCDVRYQWSGDSDALAVAQAHQEADEAVRALPIEFRTSLAQAVEDGFTDMIERLMDQVENPRAASRLRALAQVFDYHKLLEILR